MLRPLALGLGLLVAGGCPIVGDGDLVQETRTLDDPIHHLEVFDGVAASVTFDAALGDSATLEVLGDSNLLDRIITELHSSDVLGLGLSATAETRPSTSPVIDVRIAALHGAYVGGPSSLTIADVDGESSDQGGLTLVGRDRATIDATGSLDALDADLGGDSSLSLAGQVAALTLRTGDAARVDASALIADDVELGHGSSGDVQLCATGTIRGTMSGAGDLVLLCQPGAIEVERLGEGRVLPPPPP